MHFTSVLPYIFTISSIVGTILRHFASIARNTYDRTKIFVKVFGNFEKFLVDVQEVRPAVEIFKKFLHVHRLDN